MLQAGIKVDMDVGACCCLESSAVCQTLFLQVWDMVGQSCTDWDPFVQASADLDDDLGLMKWPLSLPYVNSWFWHKLQFSNCAILHDQRVVKMIGGWWMLIKICAGVFSIPCCSFCLWAPCCQAHTLCPSFTPSGRKMVMVAVILVSPRKSMDWRCWWTGSCYNQYVRFLFLPKLSTLLRATFSWFVF